MKEKMDLAGAIRLLGLAMFWSVWIYGLVAILVVTKMPEVFRDGVSIITTGHTPAQQLPDDGLPIDDVTRQKSARRSH